MIIPRRGTLAALAVMAAAARTARADTTDLAVSCDTAAAPAVRRAAIAFRKRSGVRVRVFPTMPNLLLPQLLRDIQNDIIFTRTEVIDQAEKAGLVKPGGRSGPWRNRLVTASAAGPEGTFAVPDPSPATDFDGHEVLKNLGIAPAKVLGVLDTGAVAWMLANGQARQGIVFQTDIAANEGLTVGAPVPDSAWPPVLYAATVTALAYRGDPPAFLAFLGSAEGLDELRAAGLEKAA